MASKQSTCWVIEHPEIGTAFVVADNWEQATVRAAEFWGVSCAARARRSCGRRRTRRAADCGRPGISGEKTPPSGGEADKGENEDDRREEPDAGDEGIVARGRL